MGTEGGSMTSNQDREIQLSEAVTDEQWHRWCEQEAAKSGERIRKAVEDLEARGIIDAQGRVLTDEWPADMRPDSKTDVTT
jgi:hypothetical protein